MLFRGTRREVSVNDCFDTIGLWSKTLAPDFQDSDSGHGTAATVGGERSELCLSAVSTANNSPELEWDLLDAGQEIPSFPRL